MIQLERYGNGDKSDGDGYVQQLDDLRMFAADNAVSYLSDSRSFGTASARPLLTITAVPEPGTLSLALIGLALFVWRRQPMRTTRT